ncbi:hypothetical protein [Humibacter sp.]|uniref:hypothetical protein n=1 Tax=Humibacter sp. TaxID=1940291 RepID=UPI003F8213DF
MTPPIRPEVDPLDALKALKRQANPDENDPLAQLKALKGPQQHDYHAEYASGALKQRMDAANARDAANLADEQASGEAVGPVAAFGHSLAATGANIAQGIPGMEAVQAGARSLVRGEPYRESLQDIRSATGKIPGKLAVAERVAGAVPLATFLPGSPVAGGAIIGAAEGALSADPDQSIGQRAGKAVTGGVIGGALGKAGEVAVNGVRAMVTKGAAKNLVARQAARAASAKVKYAKALQEGRNAEATDAVKEFLHDTGIEEIVDELKQTRPFQTVAHDGPEMLDAVYKVLSDRSASLKRGLDAVTPNRPNIGRFRLQDTKAAQGQLLDAMTGSPAAPGPMPSYGAAVEDYAKRSGDIEGVQRGYEALRLRLRDQLPTSKNLLRKSPEALQEWAKGASESQRRAAAQGALGAVKAEASAKPIRSLLGVRPAMKLGSVLRDAQDPTQEAIDRFLNVILLGANAARQP